LITQRGFYHNLNKTDSQRSNPLQPPTDHRITGSSLQPLSQRSNPLQPPTTNKTPKSRKNGLEISPYGALLMPSKPFASLNIDLKQLITQSLQPLSQRSNPLQPPTDHRITGSSLQPLSQRSNPLQPPTDHRITGSSLDHSANAVTHCNHQQITGSQDHHSTTQPTQ
jgi:hypothetical protein